MTAHGNMSEFDQLDAYILRANEDALAALTERLAVEERLQQLLQDTARMAQDIQEPNRDGC
jgi:hypothetical protein